MATTRKREVGRGERVLPGVWRLRLPLPLPGVPHCNAWAVAAGDGIVLVDCGMHEPGSLAHLERAMDQVNLRLEHVRLLVHHPRARRPLRAGGDDRRARRAARCGCTRATGTRRARRTTPRPCSQRRIEIARSARRARRAARALGERGAARGASGIAGPVDARPRPLLPGVEVRTDLGAWHVIETPGPRAVARLPVPARAARC